MGLYTKMVRFQTKKITPGKIHSAIQKRVKKMTTTTRNMVKKQPKLWNSQLKKLSRLRLNLNNKMAFLLRANGS